MPSIIPIKIVNRIIGIGNDWATLDCPPIKVIEKGEPPHFRSTACEVRFFH
jgi:hypothetical protein